MKGNDIEGNGMYQALYEYFSPVSTEEQAALDGNTEVQRQIYTDATEFIINSKKLLKRGQLISARRHARFVHFPMHKHNYVEIIYMFHGTTTHILSNGDTVVLEQGDLLFLNQNTGHEILPAGKEDIAINLIVMPAFFDTAFKMLQDESLLRDFLIDTLTEKSDQASYLYFQARDEMPVQNLIENMLWSLAFQKKSAQNIDQTTMGLIFMHLTDLSDRIRYGASNPYEQECIARVLAYIERNYKHAELGDLCRELKQSPSALSKFIKKNTGHTFKELLITKRMNQAAYLLSSTGLSVNDIIAAIGYDNVSYFYRLFSEKWGVTPAEYREEHMRY